ncbi:MAG TPA: alpha/beta hydrolase [Solirubrobacteraceae bacterium]|nr:alpha/beta hydrolase [Solirubrobacteraceae bacterium]
MAPLRAQGYEVIASEHGLDSLQGDVDCVVRAIGRVANPVVLVGHSYGGTLITHAGTDERVAGLVYICALAPDETETSQDQQNKFPKTDVFGHIEIADGRVWLKRSGVEYFARDLTEEEQELTWATAMAPTADIFDQKLEGVAWRTKPSWYIVGANDRTVNPDLERAAAQRMGATTYEFATSHVPMASRPGLVLDVVRTAATAVQESLATV